MHQPKIPKNYDKLLKKYEGLGGRPNQEQDQFGYKLFTETHIFYNSDEILNIAASYPRISPQRKLKNMSTTKSKTNTI